MSKPPEKTTKPPVNVDADDTDLTWADELYASDRVDKWIRGDMSTAELEGYSAADITDIANMGYAQYQNGKYIEAKTIFKGLCSLVPKESYFRVALGCVHLAEEDLETAEHLFGQAIKLNPRDQSALVNRGEVYLRTGKVLEASQDLTAAVALDPKNENALTARARALAAAAVETLEAEAVAEGIDLTALEEVSKSGSNPKAAPAKPVPPKKK